MPSQFWLVSLALQGATKESIWSSLQEKVTYVSFDTSVYKFHIPELRVGTYDSLMRLSDDLGKASAFVETVASKIRRQLEDIDRAIGGEPTQLAVDGDPVDSYMTRFQWDEAKYPLMTPLWETVDTIHEHVVKLEDDLKVRVAEYNNLKSQLNAINRKSGGSMAVRDLSSLVKPEHIVESEHLTTLLVVISKFAAKEWRDTYESMSKMVVPRSSEEIAVDNEYALYNVVLFRKVVDDFKTKARDKGFQVRDFEYNPEGFRVREVEAERLKEDQESMRSALQQWCGTAYGEVFSSWAHISAIRLFVESILRYGLPPQFLASVIIPNLKSEKKIRGVLDTLSGSGNRFWKDSDDAGMAGLIGGDPDVHPYVSVTLNLDR